MASEVANMNGTYSSQTNGDYNSSASSTNGNTNGNSAATNSEIAKDEVGWYFVEQYYTTLSRNPEKLYLFYTKRSQYVSGTEAEKVAVSVGQKAIDDRIKELDFQDCKVRVTNVDSQGSGSNIIIQVIGEMSTKSLPQKKFTQTFVLAEQKNGYFVLNDIFRYLLEDDEEAEVMEDPKRTSAETGYQEQPSTVTEEEPQQLTSTEDVATQQHDASVVNQALEKAIEEQPSLTKEASNVEAAPETANDAAQVEEPAAAETAAEEAAPELTPEAAEPEQEAEALEPEAPEAPEPTPAPSPPKPTPAQPAAASTPAAPAKPAAPKTWASMLAANRAPVPAMPISSPVATPTPAPKAAPVTPAPTAQAATPTPSSVQVPPTEVPEPSDTPVSTGSEWITAGEQHGKKQNRQQQSAQQQPAENSRGYIKNLPENVDGNALREALAKAGGVFHLDINKQKNCAFIDYTNAAAYQAAVAANPYELNGERFTVEARRINPNGNFAPRGGAGFNRGGRGGGQNGQNGGQPGRGGGGGGRGAFGGRGGGRGGAPGRGGRGGAAAGAGAPAQA